MNSFAIQMTRMSFSFRNSLIFRNVNLTISRGEFIGIFGPNGGGKTTFLKLVMGFLNPDSGVIRIFDEAPEKTRHRIGYVPQIHRTDPDFPITVAELIAMGLPARRLFFSRLNKNDWRECDIWMERLGLLAHKNKSYSELSGGLAQRALLARALIANPDLLILDEPTAHIDSSSIDILLQTLECLKGHKTILFVTHDLKTVFQRTSRLLCIENKISTFQPHEICDHFNLGLFHSPLPNQSPQFTGPIQ